jgi:hypothetical protein
MHQQFRAVLRTNRQEAAQMRRGFVTSEVDPAEGCSAFGGIEAHVRSASLPNV